MKQWKIEYWDTGSSKNSIEKWLDKLTNEQLKSVTKELYMLEVAGNKLQLPHSKALGRGLFELRERRYGYRIYYGFMGKEAIILLAAGDKKSQNKDMVIARERLSEFQEK